MGHRIRIPSLFLIVCLLGFPQISETIYTPSLPDLARSLAIHMDLAEFTLSIYFIGFALGVLVFGILADRIGRRKSMLLGIGVYTFGSLGCSLAPQIEFLLISRLIQAFGAAAGSVVTQTIMRDLYAGIERRRMFAIAAGALSFSPALGPVIGGAIDQLFHWRANFYVLTLMGIFLGIVAFLLLVETQPQKDLNPQSTSKKSDLFGLAQQMLCDPKMILYALLIGGSNGILFSYYAEAPYIFIDVLKLKPSHYGLLGLVIALAFILSSTLSISLNKKYRAEQSIKLGSLIGCIGSGLFALVAYFGPLSPDQPITQWAFLLLSLMTMFCGIGMITPNCLSQALIPYQDRSGSAGSLFGFAYYGIISGFTALMGILHNGLTLTMPLYFCCITVGMLALSLINK